MFGLITIRDFMIEKTALKPRGPHHICSIGSDMYDIGFEKGQMIATGPVVNGVNTGRENYVLTLTQRENNIVKYKAVKR